MLHVVDETLIRIHGDISSSLRQSFSLRRYTAAADMLAIRQMPLLLRYATHAAAARRVRERESATRCVRAAARERVNERLIYAICHV